MRKGFLTGHVPACVAAALAVFTAGCSWFDRNEVPAEISATQIFEVTPQNGVWDAEYGRTDDPSNCSFAFVVVRYADGIGVKATVCDDRLATDDCSPGSISCPSWDDDNLECFFDGDNDKSLDARVGDGLFYGGEYTLVANGAAQSDFSSRPRGFGESWRGTVAVSQRPEGGFRLDYDLWFSWACIGRRRAPKDGEDVEFGFNACVHDDDDGGRADRALYWKGSPKRPYRDESRFGQVVLEGVR